MLKKRLIPKLVCTSLGSSSSQQFRPVVFLSSGFRQTRLMSDLYSVAKILESQGADELICVFNTPSCISYDDICLVITKLSALLSTPLCIGGLSKYNQSYSSIFKAGADKICFNSLIMNKPDKVRQLISIYGSQSVVASADIKLSDGQYHTFDKDSTVVPQILPDWISLIHDLGFGELLVTSVDRDGNTSLGPDLKLLSSIVSISYLPLIYGGGLSSSLHFKDTFAYDVSGICASTYFLKNDHNINQLRSSLLNYKIPLRKLL